MDVLSKLLDEAVRLEKIKPHPKCKDPLVTHLSFADDLLIFFDGSAQSLQAILEVLSTFKSASGLALSSGKTFLFLDGNDSVFTANMAARFGLAHGSLPVRVRSRISSWTVRPLSFAGRLQLIQSVLFSMVHFWAAVFPLPMSCIDCLEKMCKAFLWSGAPNSAKNAKVSWESVCTPKEAGGLGLKRLADSNQVFGLKLIWLMFAGEGSLWVAWVRKNLIGRRSFWSSELDNSGSWIWRKLLKLRPLARPFLACQIRSGTSALFWHDDWTGLGPLLDISGANGPRVWVYILWQLYLRRYLEGLGNYHVGGTQF
ncbi:unnamed protein product [Microthlaspi erraticum]|uniref:Uncharacterized protein n=1 Tax=Microthlaspi erraticum TaxID=1685480 RepID=A0A6D2LAG5_9BRAS|nr:unnamed protein product [Microthlaspi erraticum]